jgi:hypothetical protein
MINFVVIAFLSLSLALSLSLSLSLPLSLRVCVQLPAKLSVSALRPTAVTRSGNKF